MELDHIVLVESLGTLIAEIGGEKESDTWNSVGASVFVGFLDAGKRVENATLSHVASAVPDGAEVWIPIALSAINTCIALFNLRKPERLTIERREIVQLVERELQGARLKERKAVSARIADAILKARRG